MKKISFLLIIFFLVVFALGIFAENTLAQNPEYELIAADVVAPGSHLGRSLAVFAEELEELSDGRISVDVYHGGALGSEREFVEMVQDQSIAFAAPGGAILGIFYAPAEVFIAPYLFEDRDHADRAWDKLLDDFSEELAAEIGIKALELFNRPPRQLSANRPVHTVEDLEGLRIRVPEVALWMETWERFGASATPVEFGELYGALEHGIVDGQENPILLTYDSGFFEVQDYFMKTRHMYQDNPLIMNAEFYEELDEDLQNAIDEAARRSAEYAAEASIEEADDRLERAKEMGVTVIEPDLSGFIEAVEGIEEDFPHLQPWFDEIKELGEN